MVYGKISYTPYTINKKMIEEIKNKAKELLKAKKVELVIGYKRASDGVSAMPEFFYKEKDLDALIWDASCVYNLSNYVKDFPAKKVAIIAKGCDIKSIIVLLQENQLKREDLFIIGVQCLGVIGESELGFSEKCKVCKPSMPTFYDCLIKEEEKDTRDPKLEEDSYGAVRKLESKSIEERLKFWQGEFERCIRCYACRQICPLCYCPRCVAGETMPMWFTKATTIGGNFSWNVTRAMHLTGRCIDCGECERACPVGIPLRDINKKIEKDVKELFNYEAGSSTEQKPLLSCFDKNDPEKFIK